MTSSPDSQSPSAFAPVSTDAAGRQVLQWALIILTVVNLLAMLVIATMAPAHSRRLLGLALMTGVAALTLWQIRRGRPHSAYRILAWGAWTVITIAVAINGGLHSSGLLIYPVLIMISGWVLGRSTIIAMAVLTVAMELALLAAGRQQWLPTPPPPSEVWILFVQALSIAIATTLAILIGRSFSTQLRALAGRNNELSTQHELNAALLDALSRAGVGMALVAGGKVVHSNAALCQLTGYDGIELRAFPSLLAIVPPEDRARTAEAYRRFLADNTDGYHHVNRIITKDNKLRDVEVSLAAMPTTGVPRSMLVMVDISLRMAAYEAARRSEERFSLVFDVMPVAACISRFSDGTFVRVNTVFEHDFGWRQEEVMGKTSTELGFWTSAADRGPGMAMLRTSGRIFDMEAQWKNRAGELRDVRFSSAVVTINGEESVLTMVYDVTEIRRAEQRFSQIFNISPIGISVTRCGDGMVVEANDAFAKLFGYTRAEILGHGVVELGILPSEEFRAQRVAFLQAQGSVINVEFEFPMRSGEKRAMFVSSGLIDAGGQPGILTFMHDITEQRHAEKMLREIVMGTARTTGDEFFHALVSHLAQALDVPFALVAEGRADTPDRLQTLAFWTEGNFVAETSYGFAGTPCERVFSGEPFLLESDLPTAFPEAYLTQATGAMSYFGYPLISAADDPLGVLAILDKKPLRASEELSALMAIFAARAAAELERQRAEAEVQQSEQNFSRVFHSSPLAASISRFTDGQYLEINDAYERLLGWRRDELIGHTTLEIGLGPNEAQRKEWGRILEKEIRVTGEEVVLRDKDGVAHHILLSTELIEFNGEKCVLAFLYDISERKRAEALVRELNTDLEARVKSRTLELTEANLELEAFAYSISHDLRAPLRGIDGFSCLLQDEYGDRLDAQGNEYLTRVRRATQRLGILIDNLLELARVTRHEMRRVDVNLSELAREVIEDLCRADPARDVAVIIEPGCMAHGDPMLLRVLLENLLGNAWKYSRNTAVARIEFGRESGTAGSRYFVRDNGVGFDMVYADKLFVPFQRLHTAADFEGSGIGLASVARIIRRHGGYVWAESAPNHGAFFSFTLDPLAAE